MNGPTYVPAVDSDGRELWLDSNVSPVPVDVSHGVPAYAVDPAGGWRRLYVLAEPAPFEHSDMCEDDDEPGDESPHLDDVGGCMCLCPKCQDSDGYCICVPCNRTPTHAHREVTR